MSITNSWSSLRLMSFESVMPSNHLILCRPLLLPPYIFPSIRVFSNGLWFPWLSQEVIQAIFTLTQLLSRRRQWQPTPVLLLGKSHGWRSLVGCSPWGCWELDMTERLHFHFSLSCTGEGNGKLLQCSCLENPRDGGAWWPAVYGVAQSRTRLKRLSSSSSSY